MDIYGDMNPGDLNDTLVGTDDPDTIFGGQGDDSLSGGLGADSLDGGEGNDTLDGGGAYQSDTLNGGNGNDTYLVHDDGYTQIVETATGGTDTVVSDASSGNLYNYQNVENLTVIAAGAVQAYGDGAANAVSDSAAADTAVLYGQGGNDTLTLHATSGGVAYGGDDADSIVGSGANDTLYGDAGNDTLTGGAGTDTFHLSFDGSVDEITDFQFAAFGVTAVRDVLDINDLLYGFSNYIYGDNPFTEADPHLQFVQEGADTVLQFRLDGTGAWSDLVKLDGVTAADLQPENLSPNFAPYGNITTSSGGDDNDNALTGSALPDAIYGYGGNDSLDGGFEADSLYGGDGNDQFYDIYGANQIYGGADNDIVYGLGSDQHDVSVYGGAGSDTFSFDGAGPAQVLIGDFEAGPGGDVMAIQSVIYNLQDFDGGNPFVEGRLVFVTDGADSVLRADIFGNGTFSDVARLSNLDWHTLTADNFSPGYSIDGVGVTHTGDGTDEGFTGTINNDTITGAGGTDTLDGSDGNDSVDGGAGDDFVYGGAGSDTVIGVGELHGDDPGTPGATGADFVQGSGLLYGEGGNDTVTGSGSLYGGDGSDTVSGSGVLYGDAGADSVVGSGGTDTLYGGTENDTLTGGAEPDSLYGGDGYDTAVYFGPRSHYTITYDGTGGYFVVDNFGDGEAINTSDHIFGVEAIQFTDQIFLPTPGNTGVTYDGGSANDTLYGTEAGGDTLRGFGGDDVIYGGANAGGAVGGGDDSLVGGNGADTLYGGIGNDTLDGGSGTDSMVGGDGSDTYVVSSLADVIVETPTGGTDTILTDLKTVTLATWANVENLVFTGAGNAALTGTAADNQLTTGAGNDSLDGGIGADTLTGGAGDDLYFVDNAGDVVVELPGGGTDQVKASISYTLAANVENLVLTVAGLTGTGNELANRISGTAGSDTLAGGLNSVAAGDTLQGGAGDDTYIVSNSSDLVQEAAGAGTDTVVTALSVYSLAAVANVENLTYAGAGAFTGTGNTLGNAITGGAGADTLDGGTGADTLAGLGGNDTYDVDNAGDQVVEAVGGGNDTVYVSNSAFVLGAGQEVETLIAAGTAGIALHGNDLANHLYGNGAANLLDGGGGADTMEGGAGADTYLVDQVGDVVIEGIGAGSDTVKTTLLAYTLTANVEALTFVGVGNFAGTGNASDNTLIGGIGNDTLDGGTGVDKMVGQLGDDVYYVDSTGDVVVENAGEGTDTVHTTLSAYHLTANVEVLHYDGTGAFNGYGNGAANTLYADAATTATLHGAGSGDTLYGGAGNDSLYGEGGSDSVFGGGGDDYIKTLTGEGPDTIDGGAGTDLLTIERTDATVALTFDLSAGGTQLLGEGSSITGIEQIRIAGGTLGDSFTGGALDDVLKGMGGADTLVGGGGDDVLQGGAGHDSLTGGLGADTFRFDGPFGGSDDTITDFTSGTDKVGLSHIGFGIASLSDFDIVTAAGGPTEAKATLIVDTTNHTISWDADGNGAGAAVLLAHGAFTTNSADYLVF